MALTWITHNGSRILYNDFTSQTEAQAMAQLDAEVTLLKTEPKKVRMLVDVTRAVIGKDFMLKAKHLAPEFESHVEVQAIVGIDTIKSIMLKGFNLVSSGVPLKPFPTALAAKDYLSHAPPH